MTFPRSIAVVPLAFVLAMSGPALIPFAAGAQATDSMPADSLPAEVGSEELAAFARATLAMAALRESFIDRIATAESETEQQALVEEGNAAIMTAIEEEPGITVERYIAINEAAQTDTSLNARIVTTLEEMAAEG